MNSQAGNNIHEIFNSKLSDKDFDRLSSFIYTNYGIKMPKAKQIMLQSRLQKRLRELHINNFKDYVDYVFSPQGQDNEVIHMIDVVSTNKTDFFREPAHFDFLNELVLPEFVGSSPANKVFKVWSAGCSSGEEPYTIAIVLSEFKAHHPGFDFTIFGTDISSRILQAAATAIFKEQRITGIPLALKHKYFLRSKDRNNPTVRIIPELRKKVSFDRLNFMDNSFPVGETFDQIFCRNVLIYFDRPTQEAVINKLCQRLKPGGYFFLGHSESITNINVPLSQIKPTIFRRI